MASISFYLDRVSIHNPKSTEERSIFLYITWKGKRLRKFTGIKTKECDWVPQIEMVNPKVLGATEVNKRLQDQKDFLTPLFEQPFYDPTPEDLRLMIEAGPQEKTLYDMFEEFITDSKSRLNEKGKIISADTVQHYRAAIQTIKEFEKKKRYHISFKTINADFYSKFRAYCIQDEKLNPNTFGSKIKKFKTFLYWCQDRDIPMSNKFWSFQIPSSYGDVEPLRSSELLEWWNLKLGDEDQEKLDAMLALCSTGMRISDYNIVMPNMNKYIQETHEGKAIIFNAKKTGEQCVVPFYDDLYFRPEHLYKKYNGKMPGFFGQKLNKWIQGAALIDRIESPTSKLGRKTLCSIKYFEQGIEAQYVMSITGHQSEKEFKKYLGVQPGTIIKGNRDKGTFLKAV